MMNSKATSTTPKRQSELYAVILEGSPVVVEATSLDEAIKKAQEVAEVKSTQEVGDDS